MHIILALCSVLLLVLAITSKAALWRRALLLLTPWLVEQFFIRKKTNTTPPPHGKNPTNIGVMSEKEAAAILNVAPNANRDTINHAYKALMKKLHPDMGGSAYFADKLNQARDVLLTKNENET